MKKSNKGLFSIKSLKNKYLSLCIVSAFLTLPFCAIAQPKYDSTAMFQDIDAFYRYVSLKIKDNGVLVIPRDTVKTACKDSGALAFKNSALYIFKCPYWRLVSAGSGSSTPDTTALTYPLRSDSLRPHYRRGYLAQSFIDSALAGISLYNTFLVSTGEIILDTPTRKVTVMDNTIFYENGVRDSITSPIEFTFPAASTGNYYIADIYIKNGAADTVQGQESTAANLFPALPDSSIFVCQVIVFEDSVLSINTRTVGDLQTAFNASGYPQINVGLTPFAIMSSNIDSEHTGIFFDPNTKDLILGDSTQTGTYLNVNSGVAITAGGITYGANSSNVPLVIDTVSNRIYRQNISGGATPTLQTVTTAGQSTTDSITLLQSINRLLNLSTYNIGGPYYNGRIDLRTTQNASYMTILPSSISYRSVFFGGSPQAVSFDPTLYGNSNLYFPTTGNTPRYFSVSVNGNYADTLGNITLSVGGSTDTSGFFHKSYNLTETVTGTKTATGLWTFSNNSTGSQGTLVNGFVQAASDKQGLLIANATGSALDTTNVHPLRVQYTLKPSKAALAIAGIDIAIADSGTVAEDHTALFQSTFTKNSTNTITNVYNNYAVNVVNSGTETNRYGYYAANATGSGTLTNQYMYYAEAPTKGGTLNYSFFSAGAGKLGLSTGDAEIGGGAIVGFGTGTAPGAVLEVRKLGANSLRLRNNSNWFQWTQPSGSADISFGSISGNNQKIYDAGNTTFFNPGLDSANRSGVWINKSFGLAYTSTISSSFSINANHYTVDCNANSNTITATLPTAVGCTGRIYIIRKSDASGNAVTVATTSSQTINGSTTYSLASQYKYVQVQSDNANWIIIGDN